MNFDSGDECGNAETRQVSQNVDKLGINPSKGFIIGGTSSGADISLTISHLYRDAETLHPLTGVYAPITSGVNHQTVPEKYKEYFLSYEQNAKVPVFSAESMKFIHCMPATLPCLPRLY